MTPLKKLPEEVQEQSKVELRVKWEKWRWLGYFKLLSLVVSMRLKPQAGPRQAG